MIEARFDYASAKTRARAEEILDDMFSNGEVCEAERPLIEGRKVMLKDGTRSTRYYITLPC